MDKMIILCFFLIVVYISILFFLAQVAQLVEQATENRCVGGSIPPGHLMKNQFIQIYILLLLIIGCKSDYTYFPHEQGLHWNYKIVFKSDYTGIEEKRDYQLQCIIIY